MDILKLRSEVVDFQVNTDGLPLFRSSGLQQWPILGRIVGIKFPFLTFGTYCGSLKLSSMEELCHNFVQEASALSDVGFILQGTRLRAQLLDFICNAPARSLLEQTKSHAGYYACDRCIQ